MILNLKLLLLHLPFLSNYRETSSNGKLSNNGRISNPPTGGANLYTATNIPDAVIRDQPTLSNDLEIINRDFIKSDFLPGDSNNTAFNSSI